MRRHAEIAHHAVEAAWNALLAARTAAQDSLTVAAGLTIDAADARRICEAARAHLRVVEEALAAIDRAMHSATAVEEAVDQAEISRFGVPVLRARAGA